MERKFLRARRSGADLREQPLQRARAAHHHRSSRIHQEDARSASLFLLFVSQSLLSKPDQKSVQRATPHMARAYMSGPMRLSLFYLLAQLRWSCQVAKSGLYPVSCGLVVSLHPLEVEKAHLVGGPGRSRVEKAGVWLAARRGTSSNKWPTHDGEQFVFGNGAHTAHPHGDELRAAAHEAPTEQQHLWAASQRL